MYSRCEPFNLHAHEMFFCVWAYSVFLHDNFSFITLNASHLYLTSMVSNQHFMGIAKPPCRAQIAQWLQAKHGLHQWKRGIRCAKVLGGRTKTSWWILEGKVKKQAVSVNHRLWVRGREWACLDSSVAEWLSKSHSTRTTNVSYSLSTEVSICTLWKCKSGTLEPYTLQHNVSARFPAHW